MDREEKILMAIDKGITCNPETGEVFGIRGNVITKKHKDNHIVICFRYNKKLYHIKAHQFIWYDVYKEFVDCIDHIDRDRSNNKIENLRSTTQQQNCWNKGVKGGSFDKLTNKWRVQIRINGKVKYIGSYTTEEEAEQSYLEQKKIHHQI